MGETQPSEDGSYAVNGYDTPNICELFVIRHGLTPYNKVHRLQGQLDVSLNDEGREQCKKCGMNIKKLISSSAASSSVRYGEGFAAVYTSPLSRARESAEMCVLAYQRKSET